jgi:hypothetical protein
MKCENRFKSATDEIIVWQIPSLLPLENINQDLFFVSSLLPIIAWLTCQKIDGRRGSPRASKPIRRCPKQLFALKAPRLSP